MRIAIYFVTTILANAALADPSVIEDATARASGDTWTVSVTLSHPDTGWDHYADGWNISTAQGEVLGNRTLVHPHVNEQPFTRSLSGVTIPDDVETLIVRARCNVDGWAGEPFELAIKRP